MDYHLGSPYLLQSTIFSLYYRLQRPTSIIRVLEDGNIKLSSVLSLTSGVTVEKLISLLCSGKKITMDYVQSVSHKRIQAGPEDILEACTGTLTQHQIFMLQLIQSTPACWCQAEPVCRIQIELLIHLIYIIYIFHTTYIIIT